MNVTQVSAQTVFILPEDSRSQDTQLARLVPFALVEEASSPSVLDLGINEHALPRKESRGHHYNSSIFIWLCPTQVGPPPGHLLPEWSSNDSLKNEEFTLLPRAP